MTETGEIKPAEAGEGVRADRAMAVVNTVGGEIAEAITPVARDGYENREHKIQTDAVLEHKFGKKSAE